MPVTMTPSLDEPEKLTKQIKDAFNRVWRRATNQPRQPGEEALMSIPPRPEVDADLLFYDRLKELLALARDGLNLREENEQLRREIEELRENNWNQLTDAQKDEAIRKASF